MGGRPQGAVELGRMQKQADKNYLSALGVKDPMADFADQFGELLKADAAKTHGLIGRGQRVGPLDRGGGDRSAGLDGREPRRAAGRHPQDARAGPGRQGRPAARAGHPRRSRRARDQAPEDEFKKQFQDLSDALGDHTITDKEFDKRKRELERQAAGEMTADVQTVSPVAAMAAGSREAYSLFARAANNSTKDDLQKAANASLRNIERLIAGGRNGPVKTLGER